ncbi:MAG: B12-binding domain-containing radical SAM protein, partial [Thermodesulfobacteriota bacterium]
MTQKPLNKPVSQVRVLLSQCFRPWGVDDEYNTKFLTYEGSNFSILDGIWAVRGVCSEVATHFIASNIPVYTMVLDNPSLKEFRDECRKGYDIIGVSSMTMTIKKVQKMIETARQACPSAVTMVGGYVTVTPGVEEVGADYICREEGANFIRRFLGLPPVDKYRNPPGLAVAPRTTIMNDAVPSPLWNWHYLSLGLGCQRGCSFCASSHYYGKRYVPLLKTGEEVYRSMIESSEGLPERRFAIFEDNFSLHKKRNLELWELAREELERPFFFFSFNELKSTSEYDPEMLAEMGCEVIFLGVETRAPGSTYFNRSKQGGLSRSEIRRLFARLHDVGIQTVAASIVTGTDEHTYRQYWDDVRFNLSLAPTFSQISPAVAMPGTGYWNQCLADGRIKIDYQAPDFDLKDWTKVGASVLLPQKPKNAGRVETLLQIIAATMAESYVQGPDLFRAFAVKHHAAKKYRNSKNKLLRRKAELYKEDCYRALPFLHLGSKRGFGVRN